MATQKRQKGPKSHENENKHDFEHGFCLMPGDLPVGCGNQPSRERHPKTINRHMRQNWLIVKLVGNRLKVKRGNFVKKKRCFLWFWGGPCFVWQFNHVWTCSIKSFFVFHLEMMSLSCEKQPAFCVSHAAMGKLPKKSNFPKWPLSIASNSLITAHLDRNPKSYSSS